MPFYRCKYVDFLGYSNFSEWFLFQCDARRECVRVSSLPDIVCVELESRVFEYDPR